MKSSGLIASARALSLVATFSVVGGIPVGADAESLVCRKVVAESPSGEGRNTGAGSRVKCAEGEMLTGGTCTPDIRPEADGTCQTSAMGVIQLLADHPETTEAAFFTCLQTGGSECPAAARTRAVAICCKIAAGEAKP
ncbi:MAG TPA: hypothetical protein VEC57_05300 [Candidatus Limnocylindrales bacterium]|nr:hypothetical protein [Candidatus Limnocylindrales bacterium]